MSTLPYAYMDPITYLPNRQNFIDVFASGGFSDCTLIMVTLAEATHYTHIQRALGHEYGDNFVRAGAARIRAVLPSDIQLFHTSMLGFAAMVPGDATAMAVRLIAALDAPLDCGGIPISTRVGVGLAPCRDAYGSDLLRAALAAAQDSRASGPGYAYYDSRSDEKNRRGFLLVTQLAEALRAANQLSLDFQPKYKIANRRAIGVEALLRWNHPHLGPISPAEFIPLVEATALINPLTDWVLDNALGQLAEWHERNYYFTVAINVSPENMIRTDFAAKMARVIDRHRVDPSFIEIEFSEHPVMSHSTAIGKELQNVRELGVHVSLDDFGTGFYNMNYLTNRSVDIVKINRAMLASIETNDRTAMLVRTMITMAHRLGYRVLADGIENASTYQLLKEWACDEGQGYFLSRVMTKAEFTAWMPLNQPTRQLETAG
jgi:EAL domain-containing protein (putative c-di-GMP-specific phosphodiesterase class I)/GGDEF domain-containing protein